MTTYTKRTNAKRAAIKAGVPEDQVEITVHKSKDGTRFGWKQREQAVKADTNPPAAKRDAPVKTTAAKQSRPEQNGVKMPSEGTKCRAVWDWMDKNPTATSKDVRAWAESTGQNPGNAQIERYQYLRFHRKEANAAA